MSTRVYDATEVTMTLVGIPVDSVGGFADGETVKIEQAEEGFKMVVGTDGTVTRSKTANSSGKITLNLMQSSPANALLSTLHNLDLKTPNGAGIAPTMIRDRQGTSVFFSKDSWIEKPPDVSYDKTATTRAWTIAYGSSDRFDGGN